MTLRLLNSPARKLSTYQRTKILRQSPDERGWQGILIHYYDVVALYRLYHESQFRPVAVVSDCIFRLGVGTLVKWSYESTY